MLKPCSSRWFYFSQFLIVVGLLAFAYYLERYQGLLPCALCEMQRLSFTLLGALFLLSILLPFKKGPQVLMNLLVSVVALFGILFAGRQVWLQYVPVTFDSGTCEASLQYMMQIMPWSQVLMSVFLGGPECAKVSNTFFYMSIADWSLLWFIIFFLLALGQGLAWLFSRREIAQALHKYKIR